VSEISDKILRVERSEGTWKKFKNCQLRGGWTSCISLPLKNNRSLRTRHKYAAEFYHCFLLKLFAPAGVSLLFACCKIAANALYLLGIGIGAWLIWLQYIQCRIYNFTHFSYPGNVI